MLFGYSNYWDEHECPQAIIVAKERQAPYLGPNKVAIEYKTHCFSFCIQATIPLLRMQLGKRLNQTELGKTKTFQSNKLLLLLLTVPQVSNTPCIVFSAYEPKTSSCSTLITLIK